MKSFEIKYEFTSRDTGEKIYKIWPIDAVEGSFDIFDFCKENNLTLTDRKVIEEPCLNSSSST